MERQSCLTDRAVPVVADTSVLINLNATKCAEVILDALPNPFLAVSEVILELKTASKPAGMTLPQSTHGRRRDIYRSCGLAAPGCSILPASSPAPLLKHLTTGKPLRLPMRLN